MEICNKRIAVRGKLVRIACLEAEGYDEVNDLKLMIDSIKARRERVDVFTFVQNLSSRFPQFSYKMEMDNFAVIHISTFDDWLMTQIDFKARNKVRKAEKRGVVVREVPLTDELIRGISEIYNETRVRQGKAFWHYGETLETVRTMNENFPGRSIFIGAFLKDSLIGFARLVTTEDNTQAGLIQVLSMIQHRDKAPTNALIAQSVRSCAERGIPYLWYANLTYGKKQEDGLAEFKRHNGFQKVEVPRYYIPLTLLGQIALVLGLHRRAIDLLPAPIAPLYRDIRSWWYARRFPGSETEIARNRAD